MEALKSDFYICKLFIFYISWSQMYEMDFKLDIKGN